MLLAPMAWGQDAAPVGPAAQPGPFLALAPYLAMFLVIYFLLLRPGNKQRQQQEKILLGLKKDDEVVTQSGIIGRISQVEEKIIVLEIAERVRVRVLRERIVGPFDGAPVKKAT